MATIRPDFNERLYEFCVNFELVSSAGALIAGYIPGIPSPQDEADLGWDAQLAMPLFGQTFLVQYKVSRLTTARAGGNAKFWDVYGHEYYRFGLHRDASGAYSQHQLLLDAAVLGVEPLYCAPLIHSRGDLVDAVRSGTVIDRSALIPVESLGPATSPGAHGVSYPVGDSNAAPTLHSEPRRGYRISREDLRRPHGESQRSLDEATFDEFSAAVLEGSHRRRRRRKERLIEARDHALPPTSEPPQSRSTRSARRWSWFLNQSGSDTCSDAARADRRRIALRTEQQ